MNNEDGSNANNPYRQFSDAIRKYIDDSIGTPQQKPEGSPAYYLGVITWGEKKLELKKDSSEDFVCAYMFKQSINARISWDEIYETMEGMKGQVIDPSKAGIIYDAQEGVNQKCLKTFGVKIFKWKSKALERVY